MKNVNKLVILMVATVRYVVIVMFMLDVEIAQRFKDAIIYGSGMLIMLAVMALAFQD